MQAEKAQHAVRTLCRALGVSPSGFYAWLRRPESSRARVDRRLRAHLRAVSVASRGTYGSPRLRWALRAQGYAVGRNRIRRLMQLEHLHGRPRRRVRVTTVSDPTSPAALNHVNQRFTTTKPNQVWAADITAVRTTNGWLYLAVLLDLYSRRVVGWAAEPSLDAHLAVTAWRHALVRRGCAPRWHHSDRGAQYTSAAYQQALAAARVRCSMSRRGNCYDNAVVESFFRTLKGDLGDRLLGSRVDVHRRIGEYIDGFYNTQRLHSTLNYQSPAAFEHRRRRAA